ncbi:carboxyltransferase subunit alpha [Amycolatopsis sp. NPDC059027]|uniref:carboxyltransferase subunit alpha n=1 Tax=unclassified Amycolatopsis TaxID=2618356 RepID=UPI00366D5447
MTPTSNGRATDRTGERNWLICDGCRIVLYRKRFERLGKVCYECGRHFRLTALERLELLLDPGSGKLVEPEPAVTDPLAFADLVPYAERLAEAGRATGLPDAVVVGRGAVHGRDVVVAVMDFRFLGGSLGAAAGAAITTAAETALAHRLPLLLVTASGGARMQEGVLSLMQMAKTAAAMAALDEAGLLTVTLVTDPTFGGVAASFATLSDVIIAEPGARMGFAGPRVIEQTLRQRLPDGFQSAEFLLRHGLVDDVCGRAALPGTLAQLLAVTHSPGDGWGAGVTDPVLRDPAELDRRPVSQVLRLARHRDRPTTMDIVTNWFDGFVPLRGDRMRADCPAIVGGVATVDGLPMMLIGHQKGHTTEELVRTEFGMPSPAGYRKAARLMRMAAKLGIPVVSLVDTPGAHPGVEAERNGQAGAIAECLRVASGLPVPVVTVIIGEGGSGGALALGMADRVLLCENATYSVISPEGCAAILWRDPEAATTAATALRIDARSLLSAGLVDGVIPEPPGGAHRDPPGAGARVRDALVCAVRELRGRPGAELVAARRARFRRFGTVDVSTNGRMEAQ